MFDILRDYGIPVKIVDAIEAIYRNSRSMIFVDDNISKEFDVTTDILQGDTLAPLLFIVVIDYVMQNAQKDHTNGKDESGLKTNLRQSATIIHDLRLTDDIALLENSLETAQMQLITTAKWAKEVDLQVINISKTQIVTNQNTSIKSIPTQWANYSIGQRLQIPRLNDFIQLDRHKNTQWSSIASILENE